MFLLILYFFWAGEMAQWLEHVLFVSSEICSVSDTHIGWVTTTCNSSPRRSVSPFWPLWVSPYNWQLIFKEISIFLAPRLKNTLWNVKIWSDWRDGLGIKSSSCWYRDLDLVPSTHMTCHNSNPNSRGSSSLFWHPQALHAHNAHILTQSKDPYT